MLTHGGVPDSVHPRLCLVGRSAVTGVSVMVVFGLDWWDPSEVVHEPAGVIPVDPSRR